MSKTWVSQFSQFELHEQILWPIPDLTAVSFYCSSSFLYISHQVPWLDCWLCLICTSHILLFVVQSWPHFCCISIIESLVLPWLGFVHWLPGKWRKSQPTTITEGKRPWPRNFWTRMVGRWGSRKKNDLTICELICMTIICWFDLFKTVVPLVCHAAGNHRGQRDLVGRLLAWRRWLCNAVPAQNNKFPQFRLAAFNEFGDQLVLRHNGYGRTWGPSSLLKKTCFNINFAVNLGCTKRKSMWVTDWICLFLPHIPKIALKHQPGSCLWRSLEAHMSSLSVTRRCSPCKCRWVVWSWASSPWRTRVSRSRNSERWTNSWQTQRLHGPCLNVGDASGQLNFLVTMARGCH